MTAPFANEPVLELRRAAVRAQLGALRASTRACRCRCRSSSAGDARTGERAALDRPGEPERVVAHAAAPTPTRCEARDRRAARTAFGAWRAAAPVRARPGAAGAAAWLRERRLELAALEVRECAKPWPEADADVCEAIDFLEYYARAALELGRRPGAAAGARGAQRASLRPARDRRRHLPLELPAGHPVRDDLGGAGGRQRGGAQARRAVAGAGRAPRPGAAGRRGARGGALAAARRGRRRRGAGPPSRGPRDRLHRLAAGRPRDRARRRRARRRPAPLQVASSPSWAARTA